MKNLSTLILLFALLFNSYISESQTNAMDFTQDECGGGSHNLFSELDAGHVVIMEFIMLNCAPCIVGTNALESITAPYESSHPGRVRIYSFGFLDSYTCEQILAWKSNNSFTHPVFNNGEEQVSYYGGMGMPTIVVTGTNEHKVFFKSIGYSSAIDDKIRQAIDSALLYNPAGLEEEIPSGGFRIFPNVFSDRINVVTGNEFAGAELLIFDTFGRQVFFSRIPENGNASVLVGGLSNGLYIARLRNEHGFSEGVRLIRQ